tara:strand:+ start:1163 stop:1666 length:504 start_codon:yes stop_codon:yes gene_type:complete
VTKTQANIHFIICQHDEITLSELAELTGKSKTNLSNVLARLKEQGKIIRSDTATYKVVNEESEKNEKNNESNESFTNKSEEFTKKDEEFIKPSDTRLLEKVESENQFLRERVEFLEQALDQEQQLNAISQKNVENLSKQMEAQRLLIEESQRPKPLLARLKAVFATN